MSNAANSVSVFMYRHVKYKYLLFTKTMQEAGQTELQVELQAADDVRTSH